MLQHKLKINDAKTEFLIIGNDPQLEKVNIDYVRVGSEYISPVEKVRNLGVIFDKNLSMKAHVANVCKKGFFQLYKLRQIRQYLDMESAERLIHAFVSSHLDYGNAMLAGLPDDVLNKLQRLQNAAAWMLIQRPKDSSITEILASLHWLPIKARISYKINMLVYKCLNEDGPQYLKELLVKRSDNNSRLDNSDLLVVPKIKCSTFGGRSFRYVAPVEWNKLSPQLRKSKTLVIFKRDLKTELFIRSYFIA